MPTAFNSPHPSKIANFASEDNSVSSIETLDLGSLWQAAQMLTGTLEFNESIERLHQTLLHFSGAQSCLLALPDRQDCWQFHSHSHAGVAEINSIDRPLADEIDRPANIIYWVRNTQRAIGGDARSEIELPDRYLLAQQPPSCWVLPLVKDGEVLGVVYLEHRQVANLFTPDRQLTLSLLGGTIAIALDNANRYRQAQQAVDRLQLQKGYLEAVLDNIPHMVWVKDRDSRFLSVNRACARVSGLEPSDLIGKTDLDIWHEELANAYRADDFAVMASGEGKVVEEQSFTTAGEPRWLETMKMPLRNGEDEIVGTIGIALDITDRKQSERDLKFTQFAVDNSADGIAWVRSDGSFAYGNKAMCQLLGYSFAEFTSLYVWDVDNEQNLSPQTWPEYWQRFRAAGELFVESETRDRHGKCYPIEMGIKNIEFEGEGYNFVRVRNITERQAALRERQQSETALRESQERNHQLISNIPAAVFRSELTVDGHYRINYASGKFFELFEVSSEAATADITALFDLVIPEDRESFYSSLPTTVSPWRWEGRIVTPKGKLKWIRGESHGVATAEGGIAWDGILTDITDRKLAEIALRNSEQRYEQLVTNVPVALYQFEITANGQQRMSYMSPRFCEMFEIVPDPTIDEVLFSLDGVHPEDRQSFADATAASVATGDTWQWEGRMFTATGKLKWIRGESTPLNESEGRVVWDGMMLDITDRKLAEIALRESEQRYEQLVANVPVALYRFETISEEMQRLDYMSPRFYEIFEVEPGTAVEGALLTLDGLHPDDRQHVAEAVALSIANGTACVWEGRMFTATGKLKWIRNESIPILKRDGKLVWDGMLIDITDRQLAELELAASRQKHYNLIQSVNGVVWEYDLQTERFTFVSDRAVDLLGYPVSDWSNENFWQQRVHPDDLDRVLTIHEEAQKYHRNCELEYRMLDARGQEIWVYDICTLSYDTEKQAIASSGLLLDISDRKQVETELQHSNERLAATNAALEKATQLKDEFLATMSHELRTPLNAILGMSEALQEQVFGDLNADQLKSIETIERGGKHLLSLINDILDVSKISAGKVELELHSISLSNLCNSSLAFIRQQARQKQIQLDLHLPSHPSSIVADERRMRQVLINLLGNAVKFTPNGGRIELAVSIRDTDGWNWEFAISDSGIGIAPADLDRLFQPFTQLDSKLNRQYEGTGLGLTLAKQIVELHGGTLSVESELDRGSCFTVRLPHSCELGGENIPPTAASDNLSPSGGVPMAAAQITIVEDNIANYHTLNSYLQAKGYQTLWAENGVAALRLLSECIAAGKLPDLVLMDIQMPEMDGIEAIERIRNQLQLKDLPIIALTALAMSGDRDRCLAAGANDYLPKPVKLKQLHTTIQQLIRGERK